MLKLLKSIFKKQPIKNTIAAEIEIKEMPASNWWS